MSSFEPKPGRVILTDCYDATVRDYLLPFGIIRSVKDDGGITVFFDVMTEREFPSDQLGKYLIVTNIEIEVSCRVSELMKSGEFRKKLLMFIWKEIIFPGRKEENARSL